MCLTGYLNCDCGSDNIFMWQSFVREKVWLGVWPGTSTVIAVQTPPLCEWALNGVSVVHHVCVYIYDVLHVPVFSWFASSVDMRAFTEDSAENWMERSRDHRKEYGTFVVIEQNWLERISYFSFGWLLEVIHVFYRLCKLLHMYFGLRELCRGHFVSDQSLGEDFSLWCRRGIRENLSA